MSLKGIHLDPSCKHCRGKRTAKRYRISQAEQRVIDAAWARLGEVEAFQYQARSNEGHGGNRDPR